MYRQLSLGYFDTEENLKTCWFSGKFRSYKKRFVPQWFLSGHMANFSRWTSEIMISRRSLSHTESKNMCIVSLCSYLTEVWLPEGVRFLTWFAHFTSHMMYINTTLQYCTICVLRHFLCPVLESFCHHKPPTEKLSMKVLVAVMTEKLKMSANLFHTHQPA